MHKLNDVQVIDDLLPNAIVEEIDRHIVSNYMFTYGHSSKGRVDGDSVFLNAEEYMMEGREYTIEQDSTIAFLLKIACIYFNIKYASIERTYINLQPKNHDGGWHTDLGKIDEFQNLNPNTYTLLYMSTSNIDDADGGQFEIVLSDGTTEKVDYVPGRFVIFRSELPHRGVSFSDRMRTSLAFKCLELVDIHDTNYEN